jgi:protein ImuB
VQEATRDLIDALTDRLEEREAGAARLSLEVKRVEATDLTETLSLSRPSRNAKHLWKLMAPRVEKLNLGYGVDRLTLRAERTASLPHDQTEAWPTDTSSGDDRLDESVAGLVDQLAERLGAHRVHKAVAAETYVPERAFRFQPVHKATSHSSPTSAVDADRPSTLLNKPQKVEVVLLSPDGPVVSMNRNGETSRIVTSIGPERITPRWWLALPGRSPWPRDYFKVQDEAGQWWWLYRKAGTSKWFVHGVWC